MSNQYNDILQRIRTKNKPTWGKSKSNHDLLSDHTIGHGLKPGDILLFKRHQGNITSGILTRFLKRMYRFWDGWGWHMAYVYDISIDGSIIVAESKIGQGVQIIEYNSGDLLGEVRVYRWIDTPNLAELKNFTQIHMGCAYDLACYFWTGLQLLIKKFLGYTIPRIHNNKYTCWELVCEMVQFMGKPLQPIERYPLIPEIVEVINRNGYRLY